MMELCASRRGEFVDMHYLDSGTVRLTWEMPLNEMVFGFF
ncbi:MULTISPECIES: hypothetical protein [Pectobacterium]|nr:MULTISPECIES: hypothetical protein [Pectobacterium]